MGKIVTVASIQANIVPHAIETNLNNAVRLLEDACKNTKIDLAVLPEDFLTGPLPQHLDLAISESDQVIKTICNIAVRFNLYLVAGSLIIREEDGYYNTSLLISPSGEILLKYRKNNLWHPEKKYLKSGTQSPVIKTPIGTIGIAICWDLAFPAIFEKMAIAGADIICVPSYWTSEDAASIWETDPDLAKHTEATFLDTLCPARAIENECLIIYSNGAGKAEIPLKTVTLSLNQVGHSQICAPLYGTVAKIDSNKEGYITYSYDRDIKEKAERAYKLRRDKTEWRNQRNDFLDHQFGYGTNTNTCISLIF